MTTGTLSRAFLAQLVTRLLAQFQVTSFRAGPVPDAGPHLAPNPWNLGPLVTAHAGPRSRFDLRLMLGWQASDVTASRARALRACLPRPPDPSARCHAAVLPFIRWRRVALGRGRARTGLTIT